MGPGMTYTGGLTTAVWTMKLPGELYAPPPTSLPMLMTINSTGVADCSVGKTLAVCTESMGGSGANFPGVSTVSFSDDALTHMPVTITAGNISSVSGASPATTTTTTPATPGAATTAAGAATVTDKTSVSGETGAASQTGSGTGTSTTASTGGLPAVTGNVGVVGGIAVAVAAAVL